MVWGQPGCFPREQRQRRRRRDTSTSLYGLKPQLGRQLHVRAPSLFFAATLLSAKARDRRRCCWRRAASRRRKLAWRGAPSARPEGLRRRRGGEPWGVARARPAPVAPRPLLAAGRRPGGRCRPAGVLRGGRERLQAEPCKSDLPGGFWRQPAASGVLCRRAGWASCRRGTRAPPTAPTAGRWVGGWAAPA